MKYKHTKSKNTKSVSLIVVPNTNSRSSLIKQVKFATWIPKFIIFLMIISIVATGYLIHSYIELKDDYIVKIDNLDQLKGRNLEQKKEIDSLQQKTTEIEERLEAISQLQEAVKEKVGLKDDEKDQQGSSTISSSSRGGTISGRTTLPFASPSDDIEMYMDELNFQLAKSEESLIHLISDVEQRLDYLDAKPNLMPTTGRISSGFGYRRNPFGRGTEFHSGLDIANSTGTKIVAAGSGVVTYSQYNGSYGKVVVISHGYGYQSIYGHNYKIDVKVGDQVEKGQQIALMGSSGRSTGPHVHFEIRHYGKAINPETMIGNNE